jgi:putative ABC transport system ATP-binding protein
MNLTETAQTTSKVIEVQHLSRIYEMGSVKVNALLDASFHISKGEFVALMGSSGSGKSTLLHLLGCLDTPTSGKYFLEDQDVSDFTNDERAHVRNQRIGFIFQTFNLLSRISALDNVALPLLYRKSHNGVIENARDALEKVGLLNRLNHKPMELSGGERQRVAIARALVTKPVIILADEPTGNLDSKTGREIMELLTRLNEEGSTILLVTHDPKIAKFAHRKINMLDGKIMAEGNQNELA